MIAIVIIADVVCYRMVKNKLDLMIVFNENILGNKTVINMLKHGLI